MAKSSAQLCAAAVCSSGCKEVCNHESQAERAVQSLWGEYCMFCGADWDSTLSCRHCENTYDKLKAQGNLPRRREAILATRATKYE